MAHTFKFYSDPGHGWIGVKRTLLQSLGILNQITRFSYQRGGMVYLEEDVDAGTFVKAYREKIGELTMVPSRDRRLDRHPSRIRSYESFRP